MFNDPINNTDPSGFLADGADSTIGIMGWGGALVGGAAATGFGAANAGSVAGGALGAVGSSMAPKELRLVANFLARIADDIDSGRPFLHRHIKEVVPDWLPSDAQVDIVAVAPDQQLMVDDSGS